MALLNRRGHAGTRWSRWQLILERRKWNINQRGLGASLLHNCKFKIACHGLSFVPLLSLPATVFHQWISAKGRSWDKRGETPARSDLQGLTAWRRIKTRGLVFRVQKGDVLSEQELLTYVQFFVTWVDILGNGSSSRYLYTGRRQEWERSVLGFSPFRW